MKITHGKRSKKGECSSLPGMEAMRRIGLCVWLAALFTATPLQVVAASPGLDSRPDNTSCLAFDRPNTNASVDFQRVFPSLLIDDVVVLTQPPGDSSYWYFTTRDGIIGRFANSPDVSSWETVADLGSDRVAVTYDGGLIQLVFHPGYPLDRRVFVNYTTIGSHDEDYDIIVSSFEVMPNGKQIKESSEVILITQPRGTFHQGGFMAFGTEGYLYLGIGDGAPQQDPENNSQNLMDLRGSILRIDVDNAPPDEVYGIPVDNPFSGSPGCAPIGNSAPCPEIFASGLRNPYRGDIDPVTGDIWVGDVGYTSREEIDKIVIGGNYGWNVYEGTLCQGYSGSCDDTSLIEPVLEYSHANGQCAVIGGFVYRGNAISELQGKYLFADFCSSKVSAVQYDIDGNAVEEILLPGGSGIGGINTFARDNDGEHYVVTGSEIYKIVDSGGEVIPQDGWSLLYADSEESSEEDGMATNAFDGDPLTIWHTEWSSPEPPPPPHEIQIDLGAEYNVDGFRHLPRSNGTTNGRIASYEFYVSQDGVNWGTPVDTGVLANLSTEQGRAFAAKTGRYVRLVALSEVEGRAWTTLAELNVLGFPAAGSSGGGGVAPSVPALLSQTGCFDTDYPAVPVSGLIPFDINSKLWSDGASKRRWMALPDGATVAIDVDGDFLFPAGSILIKEFAYDGVPHETRLYVRHTDGIWAGYSYEWREDGSDADLLPAGKVKDLGFGRVWTYPSRAECLSCHTDTANFSLGLEVAQLNREMLYPQTLRIANQLQTLDQIGIFTDGLPAGIESLPAYAELDQAQHSVQYRARSYLHSNCSGCHRPGEVTQAPMDFRFSTPTTDINVCNVTPAFGDLGVTDAKILLPGSPDHSVLKLRDESRNPLIQMPPLGTAMVHNEWVSLLESWITDTTLCDPDTDTDSDGVLDELDNCVATDNASQRDTDVNGIGDACELTANAGVDQYLTDSDANGTEPVSLDGSESTNPDAADPITSRTWRKDGLIIAFGETALINLAAGSHIVELEVGTEKGNTDTDILIVKVLVDTDSDGTPDSYDRDDDNDGLYDTDEALYGTNPLLIDTDGDGLSDAEEVGYDGDINNYTPGLDTDPLLADTDGDGLTDSMDPIPLVVNVGDGDLAPWNNPDGQINAADILVATQLVLGRRTAATLQYAHGDINLDGIINLADLLLLQKLILH